ncbi:Laminin subunit alpha-2 [Dufourea novaeangliae]|uniref:Laminin subunit alpha-2 n=1 Tax=Dufourea novaeangliae TaxID=178035 RepID=A0A154P9Z9_DUFNO|nr:Laminin subunit alpha-2 [Dufourea novaeangliae]
MFFERHGIEKSHVTFYNLEKRLCEHGGLCKKSRNKPKLVINENNTVNILAAIKLNPQISQRKLAQTSHISRSSIQRILKQQKYHPYHLILTQELSMADYDHRVTFCEWLQGVMENILKDMKSTAALAPYLKEYTRLFESLYKAHRVEKELLEKCESLQNAFDESEEKAHELSHTISNNNEEIEKLKQELVNTIKRADATHTRELNAQEMIENLRLNVAQLNLEIEQKNRQIAAAEDVSATKQKENLMKEKEKLMSEMDTLRQRLKNMSLYTEELEKRTTEYEHQTNDLRESMDAQLSEISKERRARQRAEDEILQLQEELSAKSSDLETANVSIQAAAANVLKLESLLKDHRAAADKTQKEMNKLMVKKMNLQTDYDNAVVQIENLDKEIAEKDKQLKEIKYSSQR